jgi:hypothetical protein
MRNKSKPRKTMRIQYGTGEVPLYWTVKVTDAKQDVIIDGTLWHAITGTPGHTIGCHLSNCAKDNKHRFPHPFLVASFTKATCAIATKVTNGAPSHAVRYMHSYGKLVDLNDTDKTRQTIKNNPEMAERSFVLRAPKGLRRKGGRKPEIRPTGKHTGTSTHFVPRGALSRARKAGLVTADLANALNQID